MSVEHDIVAVVPKDDNDTKSITMEEDTAVGLIKVPAVKPIQICTDDSSEFEQNANVGLPTNVHSAPLQHVPGNGIFGVTTQGDTHKISLISCKTFIQY